MSAWGGVGTDQNGAAKDIQPLSDNDKTFSFFMWPEYIGILVI